jgi:rRNA maturation endonuclease Nob1
LTVALLAALGATVVAFVLYPVFAESRRGLEALGDTEREILDLEEKKSRLYSVLTDLDFEKEAGKVSESDYQTARNDYLAQVAAVLARLDAIAASKGEKKKARKGATCEGCGEKLPPEARFCMACGKKVGP